MCINNKMKGILVIIYFGCLFNFFVRANLSKEELLNNFQHVRPSTTESTQKDAVLGVISRLIPDYAHLFNIEIDFNLPENSFKVIKNDSTTNVLITASNGVSACKGFYHYLKYVLNCHVSWSGVQLQGMSDKLPSANIEETSASRFIYHQNVCTWSYSYAWWNWRDWRKHIDWMALMGISLSLAPIQEAIWTKVYRDFGLTWDEIDDHISGPAFHAWQRMGNIRGWGGPASKSYKSIQLTLQKKIIEQQRNLGMVVAIPAFAGHLPNAFQRLFPNSTFTPINCWNRFPQQYCCPLFVDPTDPVFHAVGVKFLRAVIHEYGTDHIYFSDPFNEIQPRTSDTAYLSEVSMHIYDAMETVDTNAIWLLQAWMFELNPFWTKAAIKSFLTAVPIGKMLILDLQSELFPQYERTDSYYGQPFIWCMLHNFGGTLGMHGSVHIVNSRISEARALENSTMVGVGITMEGINQNYALYEFALERGWWHLDFDEKVWFEHFSRVRYGIEDEFIKKAWDELRTSVYSYHGLEKFHGKYTVCRRPGMNIKPWTWYNQTLIWSAWTNMLNANESLSNNHLFQHDLVDITRQFLQNKGDHIYVNIIASFKAKNIEKLRGLSELMKSLLLDLDRILRTNEHFLLGKWIKSAKKKATSPLEREVFEMNARNQITTWGPDGQIVDYATKQWSGLVGNYFLPRWTFFLDELESVLTNKTNYNENRFRKNVFKNIENPFNIEKKVYPDKPRGNSIVVSKLIYSKWDALASSDLLVLPIPMKRSKIIVDF